MLFLVPFMLPLVYRGLFKNRALRHKLGNPALPPTDEMRHGTSEKRANNIHLAKLSRGFNEAKYVKHLTALGSK